MEYSTRTPSGKESRKLVGWYCDLLVYFFAKKGLTGIAMTVNDQRDDS